MAISLDYRSFSPAGPTSKVINRYWWEAKGDDLAEAISSCIHTLQEANAGLEAQRSVCTRLYGNSPLYGVSGLSYSKLPSQQPVIKDRITYNICQSVVDTKTAKIAKNRPKPLFLTEKGNYKLRRKAQKLNQFMDGVFFANRIREVSPMVFRDADILGTGAVHIFGRNNQVNIERVMIEELLVDERESLNSDPRQLHRVKDLDRQVVLAMFPDKAKIINATNEALDPSDHVRPHISDQITVAESWRLPSGPNKKDGMHAMICDGGVLLVEPWDHDFFPFAFMHSSKRQRGFWGQGAVERLQNIQLEVNKILWVIQRTYHLGGSFKILLEQGSKVVKEHLNNDIGSIVNYTGTMPQYVTPPLVQPEVYQHLAMLIQRGFEQEGISMLSATARKPEGLDSGKALREYNDIETERFMVPGQGYEQFHMDIAKISVATARDIYTENKKAGLKVKFPGSKFIETIDWADVDLDDDKYVIQCFPVSSLPNDPAGRLSTIQEYIQAGFIDQRQGRRLMDFPDLDQVEGLANAVEERILGALDQIIDEGVFTAPDEYMDPQLARELSLQYINEYSMQDLEEEKLQMLRDFNGQVGELEAKAAQAMQATQPQPGATPANPSPGLTAPAQMPPPQTPLQ